MVSHESSLPDYTPEPSPAGPRQARAKGPPMVRRPPRARPPLPRETISVQPPPPLAAPPAVSLIEAAPALFGLLALLLISAWLMVSGSGDVSQIELIGVVLSLLTLIGGALGTFLRYRLARRSYEQERQRRAEDYGTYLAELLSRLQHAAANQRKLILRANPSPDMALQRLLAGRKQGGELQMWERQPSDDDFLHVRLGTGAAEPSYTLDTTALQTFTLRQDELVLRALSDLEPLRAVDGVALTLPLSEVGVVGIVGERHEILDLTRAMLLHLALQHAPGEVKLVILYPGGDEYQEWAWTRWLPHVWSDGFRNRYVADTPRYGVRIVAELDRTVDRRRRQVDLRHLPRWSESFVVVFADENLAQESGVPRMLRNITRAWELGVYTIFLSGSQEELFESCRAIITCAGGQATLTRRDDLRSALPVAAIDRLSVADASIFGRAMAPLRLAAEGDFLGLRRAIGLFETLGIARVDDLAIGAEWPGVWDQPALRATIGFSFDDEPLVLDLHERGDGSHLLIAGERNAGKTVLLQSLIAALAARYHPSQIGFVIIDPQNRSLAETFRNLPHQVGMITTTTESLLRRAIDTLQAVVQRRETLFAQQRVGHIDQYIRAFAQGEATVPLPHLFIVIDDADELLSQQPAFSARLLAMIKQNPHLGLHLVVAVNQPGSLREEQLWEIGPNRICLRVAHAEDSKRVVEHAAAADLGEAGQAYLWARRGERQALFQVSSGGLPYGDGDAVALSAADVYEITIDGTRSRLLPAGGIGGPSQLDALVEQLYVIAERRRINSLSGPWLSPPADHLALEYLRTRPEGWNGRQWVPTVARLSPLIGISSDSARHVEELLAMPLSEQNLAILGNQGAGKTTMLKTVLTSLVLDHSPADLQIYLFDGGGTLQALLGALPHLAVASLPQSAQLLDMMIFTLLRELGRRQASSSGRGWSTGQRPDLVVACDDYAALVAQRPRLAELVLRLAREGQAYGIHIIVAANDPAEVPPALRTALGATLQLQAPEVDPERRFFGEFATWNAPRIAALSLPGAPATTRQVVCAFAVRGGADLERDTNLQQLAGAIAQSWTGQRVVDSLVAPDPYEGYELSLGQLLAQITTTSPYYADVLVYEQRLRENIHKARGYGDTDELENDRAQIVDQLNRVALQTTGRPFLSL